MDNDNDVLRDALAGMLAGVKALKEQFKDHNRHFTLDGRLLGDIGEIIAWQHFDIDLDPNLRRAHDATFAGGRRVNIKVTMKDKIAIRYIPDYCLALKLHPDASHEVIFNGPGRLIQERWAGRKGIGVVQLGFEIHHLRELNKMVREEDRVPRRIAAPAALEGARP